MFVVRMDRFISLNSVRYQHNRKATTERVVENKERNGRNRDKFLKAINQTYGSKKPVRAVILANYWMPKLDGVETNEKKPTKPTAKKTKQKTITPNKN